MPTLFRNTAVVMLVLLLTACTTKLSPPVSVTTPRSVYVLDHGHHTSLVLSDASGHYYRYAYGDWRYYALTETGPWSGLRALLTPTQAALGRREFTADGSVQNIIRAAGVTTERVIELQVEAERVDALHQQLEQIYQDNLPTRHRQPAHNFDFVKHPQPYTLRHNSNRMVADWLTQMDVTVSRRPTVTTWQLEPP